MKFPRRLVSYHPIESGIQRSLLRRAACVKKPFEASYRTDRAVALTAIVVVNILRILAILVAASGLNATAAVHYVDLNSASPTPPYSDWSTAATNIQDAITAASSGDLIWVTNGVYQTGGKTLPGSFVTNRVFLDKPLTVASVNGPLVTALQGASGRSQARCAYVTNGALLAGFTLTNGTVSDQASAGPGGGVYCQSALARLEQNS